MGLAVASGYTPTVLPRVITIEARGGLELAERYAQVAAAPENATSLLLSAELAGASDGRSWALTLLVEDSDASGPSLISATQLLAVDGTSAEQVTARLQVAIDQLAQVGDEIRASVGAGASAGKLFVSGVITATPPVVPPTP